MIPCVLFILFIIISTVYMIPTQSLALAGASAALQTSSSPTASVSAQLIKSQPPLPNYLSSPLQPSLTSFLQSSQATNSPPFNSTSKVSAQQTIDSGTYSSIPPIVNSPSSTSTPPLIGTSFNSFDVISSQPPSPSQQPLILTTAPLAPVPSLSPLEQSTKTATATTININASAGAETLLLVNRLIDQPTTTNQKQLTLHNLPSSPPLNFDKAFGSTASAPSEQLQKNLPPVSSSSNSSHSSDAIITAPLNKGNQLTQLHHEKSFVSSSQVASIAQVTGVTIDEDFTESHNLSAIITAKPAKSQQTTSIVTTTATIHPTSNIDSSHSQSIQSQSKHSAHIQIPLSRAMQQAHQQQHSRPIARLQSSAQQIEEKEIPFWSVHPSEVTSEYSTILSDNNNNNNNSNNEIKATTTKIHHPPSNTNPTTSETIQNDQGRILLTPDKGTATTISFLDPTLSAVTQPDTQYLTTASANFHQTNTLSSNSLYIPSYITKTVKTISDSLPSNSNQRFKSSSPQFVSTSKVAPVERFDSQPIQFPTSSPSTNMINAVNYSGDNNGSNGTILNHNLAHSALITNDQNYFGNNSSIISAEARSVCVTAAYLCVIFVNKTFEECDQNLCGSYVVNSNSDVIDEESLQRAMNRMLDERFTMIELTNDMSPLLYNQESILTISPTLQEEHLHQNDEKFSPHQQLQSPSSVSDENKQQQKFIKQSQNNQILTPVHAKTKLELYNDEKFKQQQTTPAPPQPPHHFTKSQLQHESSSASILGWIPITIPPLSSLGSFSFSSSSFPVGDLLPQQQSHVDQSYPRQPQESQLQTHDRHNQHVLQQQQEMANHESYIEFPANDKSIGSINKEKVLAHSKITSSVANDKVVSSLTATRMIRPHQQSQQQSTNKYEALSTTLSELLSGSLLHSQIAPAPSNVVGSGNSELDSEAAIGIATTNSPIQSIIMKNKNLQQHIKHRYKLQPQTSGPMFSSVSNQATTIAAINFLNKNNEMTPQSVISDDGFATMDGSPNGNKCQANNNVNLGPNFTNSNNCNKCDNFPTTSSSMNPNQANVNTKWPPTEVSFILYTRWNKETAGLNGNDVSSYNGDVLDLNDDSTIDQSHLNKSYPIKFIIHGFGSGGKRPWVMDMAYKLLDFDKVNVIVVDWEKGSALPNYVQAASNTRYVGHRIACLIKRINSKFGLSGDNYHLIGFSLGAHVAGYAGMEIRNSTNNSKYWINRITGLDPASPLFEGYEAYHRLDPSDAQFVDVIHSNGDGVLRGGLGSLQPMGHVDFYPNGGRVQVGCNSVLLSALSDIIYGKWQTLCNHRRALNFFMDTLESNRCKFRSFNCDSYENYLRGECFECGVNHEKCSEMGYSTNRTEGRGKMYLTTSETGPFCANQFVIKLIGTSGYSTYWGKVEVVLLTSDGKNETYLLSATNQQVGDDNGDEYVGHVQSLIVAQATLNNFTYVLLRYTKYKGWIYSGQENWSIDKLYITDSDGQVKSYCGYNTLLGSQLLTKLRLEAHNCTIEVATVNTKQPSFISSSTQTSAISQHPITTRSGRFFWPSHGSTNAHHVPINIW